VNAKAIILLSGGLDSSTVLYQAKADGCDCYALSFDYGQRHHQEIGAAKRIAQAAGAVEHRIVSFDMAQWGGSSLTDTTQALPKGRPIEEMGNEIPTTYVPARNTIFLSFGLSYAEAIDADWLYIGVNALDYSGYPDCRPDYTDAMQNVFRLGTKRGREGNPTTILKPLIHLKKTEIIEMGNRLGVPWQDTWSCYAGGPAACGQCDSCRLRLQAFADLGLRDPLPYVTRGEIA